MNDMLLLSATELGQKIKPGEISPVEAVDACLARIEATEPNLNAYVRVLADEARAAANQAEQEIAAGQWKDPLHGVPVALKDLYDLAGVPTTASSRVRESWTPDADSAAAERLKAAGAIVLGKTHTHEFACGIVTPTTRNPWDTERTPGGSSGGSGAKVVSAGAFMAMGSDTGGSIRIPAGLCGTVGLKPTFGRVSRAGITSLSWGLYHAGPLTRTVEDAATCVQVLAGYDPRDPGSVDEPVPDYSAGLRDGIKGLRVGVPSNYFFDQLDEEVEAAVRKAYEQLESLGAELVDVALPMPEQLGAVEFAILLPEASDYHCQMLRDGAHLYNDDVRVMVEAGEFVPATTYTRAQRVRNLLQQEFRKLYGTVDVIVAPTVAASAVTAGTESITWPDGSEEPLISAYTRFAVPGNVTGLPCLSVPCGFSSEGLPIGFQAIGRPLDEATFLRLGAAY
ncbi:glutamyl-tRNA(Gln) amidotransferase subunit A [Salinisphaera sp. C84B14]|uniref:amidase n=1 Tax=Salinisphaera sp. C84B14 TaxID=1304155 RepID=UPI003341982A